MNHNNPDNFFADPGPHARQNFGGVYITSPQPAPCEVNWIGNPSRTVVSTRPTDAELADLRQQLAAANARAARAEMEREELRGYWTKMRTACNAIAWAKYDNVEYPRRVAMDVLAIGCKLANERAEKSATDGLVEAVKQAEKDRDVLAKEVRQLRTPPPISGGKASDWAEWQRNLREIQQATDASKALDRAGGG